MNEIFSTCTMEPCLAHYLFIASTLFSPLDTLLVFCWSQYLINDHRLLVKRWWCNQIITNVAINFTFLMLCTCMPGVLRKVYSMLLHVQWGVVAERSSLPGSSSGVSSRVWVRVPVVTLVSLSKTLNHNCFVLRMGRKAVGPVCCVMHVKEPRTLIVKEKGLALVFLEWQLNAPKSTLSMFRV